MSIQYLEDLSDGLTVDELWLEFVRVCDVIGAKNYIKFGSSKGEWSEKSIKDDIAKYMKSKPEEMDDIAVFDHNGKEEEYPKVLYYCFKEIGRKGKGADDKLIRKVFHIKKVKKGLFAKLKKTVSKAAKGVTKAATSTIKKAIKSASSAVNAIAKSPILSAISAASPVGPIIAAAKLGKAAKMVAMSKSPLMKKYKKQLQAKIKAEAAKLGIKGDAQSITIALNNRKAAGKPIPEAVEAAVAENAAITMAEQSGDTVEVSNEIDVLESRIRNSAVSIGIAQSTDPIDVIVNKAKAQLNVQLDDVLEDALEDYYEIGEETGGDESGKLKEDVTQYVLLKQAQGDSGGGNTMLYVGLGAAVLGAAYFMTKGK
jgi:hypothetical protein